MRKYKMFLFVLTLVIALVSPANGIFKFSFISDVMESVKNKSVRAIGGVPNLVAAVFDSQKQALMGLPFKVVAYAINTMCFAIVSPREVKPRYTPDVTKMKLHLHSGCKRLHFPLLDANEMWSSRHFDPRKKVVILATGWLSAKGEAEAIDVIAQAYNCRGNINFVVLDAASYVDTLYSWSALNTRAIGRAVAQSLEELVEGVPVEQIHLIGHSLGAHICGYAARYFHALTNKTLPRITALDPALPCFNEGEKLSGLQRGDAEFIDVIHSNSGVLGKEEPTGDADFYPNGVDPLPPGCYSVLCAHSRAWQYYAESVYPGNEKNFRARRCSSINRLRKNLCTGIIFPMGYATPHNIRGNYFLEVNSRAPYGKDGSRRRIERHKKCGACKQE